MNSHQVETIVTLSILIALGWFLVATRKRGRITTDGHVDEYRCRVLTPADRLGMYREKLVNDEALIRRQANGIEVQKRVIERTHRKPVSTALVPVEPTNIVPLKRAA